MFHLPSIAHNELLQQKALFLVKVSLKLSPSNILVLFKIRPGLLNIHLIFVTVTVSVVVSFLIITILKFCFAHSVVSQKSNKRPVSNKRQKI